MKYDYELIVIGTGSAGFNAAQSAKKNGVKKICMIEKRALGYSLCTNEGCMPSKTIIATAERKRMIESADALGIKATKPIVEWRRVQNRVKYLVSNTFAGERKKGIQASGIKVMKGEAAFINQHEIQVGKKTLTAEKIVIATGSEVFVPPIGGLESAGYITSDEALFLTKLPKSLLIIGGGIIAIEIGTFLAHMGVEITIIEQAPRLLARFDKDVSDEIAASLKKLGVKVLLNAQVESVYKTKKVKEVVVAVGKSERKINVAEVMVATGRKAAIEGLAIENAGIKTDERGSVVVNDYLQTNVANIYAAGDINGKVPLVYVAGMEGRVAGANVAGKKEKIDYTMVSSVIFSSPEIGTIGITEQDAKKAKKSVVVGKVLMKDIGKAVALAEPEGFIKLIAEKKTGKILGMQVVGVQATDIMQVVIAHIYHGDTVYDILAIPYPHPTLGEALSYAADEVVAQL